MKKFARMSFLLVALMGLMLFLAACGDDTTVSINNGNNNNAAPKVQTGYNSSLAGSFPSNTAVYVTLNTDAKTNDQIKGFQNIVNYLSNIPEVKSGVDMLVNGLNQSGFAWDTEVKSWLGKEVAIGLTDANSLVNLAGGKQLGEIPVVVAAQITSKDKANAFVGKLLTMAGVPAAQAQKETVSGYDIQTFNVSPVSISVAVGSDKLFITGGPNLAKLVIAQDAGKSLTSNASFKNVTGKLPSSNLTFAYLDYQQYISALLNSPQIQQSLQGSMDTFKQLAYLKGIGVTFATADEGFRIDSYQEYDESKLPAALKETLSKPANSSKIISNLPSNAFAFINSRDLASSYKATINQLGSMGGATAGTSKQQIDDALAQFEQQTGISIEKDIVPLFSGEFGAFATAEKGDTTKGETPVGFGFVANVTDKTKATDSINKIVAALEKAGASSSTPVKFADKTVDGVTYKSVSVPNSNVQLNIGIAGDNLFFTITDASTQAVIAASKGNGFDKGASKATFDKLKGFLPTDNTGYGFLDIQAAFKLVQDNIPAQQKATADQYLSKLTSLKGVAFASHSTTKDTYSTIYILFPVTK